MEYYLHAVRRFDGDVGIGEITDDEFDRAGHGSQVGDVACRQVVDDANRVTARHQFHHKVRADESRTSGHQTCEFLFLHTASMLVAVNRSP
jgi:hypothetical protein